MTGADHRWAIPVERPDCSKTYDHDVYASCTYQAR